MKYFFDTEFIEDGKTIDLISIGIVCEDGREFYALNFDCDWNRAGDWVKQNVLPLLPKKPENMADASTDLWLKHNQIGYAIKHFCSKYKNVEFWAYYADYDWVALCQTFGTMMDLPEGFPMYCRDLIQLADSMGQNEYLAYNNPDNEHNALSDARWNRDMYSYLMNLCQPQTKNG